MKITFSVIKADVGGFVGRSAMHEELIEEAEERCFHHHRYRRGQRRVCVQRKQEQRDKRRDHCAVARRLTARYGEGLPSAAPLLCSPIGQSATGSPTRGYLRSP